MGADFEAVSAIVVEVLKQHNAVTEAVRQQLYQQAILLSREASRCCSVRRIPCPALCLPALLTSALHLERSGRATGS